jgi:hypothetical protein
MKKIIGAVQPKLEQTRLRLGGTRRDKSTTKKQGDDLLPRRGAAFPVSSYRSLLSTKTPAK